MNKYITGLVLAMGISLVVADDTTHGYVMSIYGSTVKGSYGQCIHTAYYNADIDGGRAECGDKRLASSVSSVVLNAPQKIVESITLSEDGKVFFEFATDNLTADGGQYLKSLSKQLIFGQISKVVISGYTDAIGAKDVNLKLSQARADKIKGFFITNKVNPQLISATGYGSKEALLSTACFKKYGSDRTGQLMVFTKKLGAKKFKSPHLSRKMQQDKIDLQIKISGLQAQQQRLVDCTAADRKVVFTLLRNENKEVSVAASSPVSNR